MFGLGSKLKIGDSAPDFKLQSTHGNWHTLADFNGQLLCIFFTCEHCPYAKAYEERIMHLADEFAEQVSFVGINSNDAENYPEDSFEKMKAREQQEELNYTYLRDETQETAKAYGGECTPHFFLFDKERKLRYEGRLDNDWKHAEEATKQELQEAIISLLDGKKVPKEHTSPMGCSIKWKK